MKSLLRFLLCCPLIFSTGGCTFMHHEIIESKDVQFFKVEKLPGEHPVKVRLSGLAFKSAMSVTKITTKIEGSAIIVSVHLALAKPGTSGSFEYDLVVPDSVR